MVAAGWNKLGPDVAVAGEDRFPNTDSGTDGDLPLHPLSANLFENGTQNDIFVFFSQLIGNEGSCRGARMTTKENRETGDTKGGEWSGRRTSERRIDGRRQGPSKLTVLVAKFVSCCADSDEVGCWFKLSSPLSQE